MEKFTDPLIWMEKRLGFHGVPDGKMYFTIRHSFWSMGTPGVFFQGGSVPEKVYKVLPVFYLREIFWPRKAMYG